MYEQQRAELFRRKIFIIIVCRPNLIAGENFQFRAKDERNRAVAKKQVSIKCDFSFSFIDIPGGICQGKRAFNHQQETHCLSYLHAVF